jgi:hypothetical protein
MERQYTVACALIKQLYNFTTLPFVVDDNINLGYDKKGVQCHSCESYLRAKALPFSGLTPKALKFVGCIMDGGCEEVAILTFNR